MRILIAIFASLLASCFAWADEDLPAIPDQDLEECPLTVLAEPSKRCVVYVQETGEEKEVGLGPVVFHLTCGESYHFGVRVVESGWKFKCWTGGLKQMPLAISPNSMQEAPLKVYLEAED